MSAIFTPGQGAVFFTETSARSSALAGVFPTETLVLGGPPDLIGDLFIPSITFAGALSLANYKLVTVFSPNVNRSNATGQYGYTFQLITPTTFNRLGVLAGGTNTGICTINLYTWQTTLQASWSVDLTGTVNGQWVYIDIPPITLPSGPIQFLTRVTTSGDGQTWADSHACTLEPTLVNPGNWTAAYIDNVGAVHSGTSGAQYCGIDLSYSPVPAGPSGALNVLQDNQGLSANCAVGIHLNTVAQSTNDGFSMVMLDMTTTEDNCIVFVGLCTWYNSPYGNPSDLLGLNWTVRYFGTDQINDLALWQALQPTAGRNQIFIPMDGINSNWCYAWAIADANVSSPNDANGSLPSVVVGSGGTVSAHFATTNSPDFVFGINRGSGLPTGLPPLTTMFNDPSGTFTGFYYVAPTPQSQTGVTPGVSNYLLFDAVVESGGTPSPISGALNLTQDAQALTGAAGPTVKGTLGLTQSNQTVVATAFTIISGALNQAQAPHSLTAQAKVSIGAILNLQQADHALAGAGGVTARATLALTQDPQSLVAAGGPVARGALNATQQAQTLAGNCIVFTGATLALNLTQQPQTISALGFVPYTASLNLTQAPQVLAGKGDTPVVGMLNVGQASQSLTGKAGPVVRGLLAQTQLDQTITASGALKLTGTLSVTQEAQTLIGAGNVPSANVIGTLRLTQDVQTLAGAASLGGIVGHLIITQDAQTLSGQAGLVVRGALNQTQTAQHLDGLANGGASASLIRTQADQTLSAAGSVPYVGALNLAQAPQTLVAKARAEILATLSVAQGDQTLTGKAGPLAAGRLTALQENHVLTGNIDAAGGARLNIVQDSQILVGVIQGSNPAALALTQDSQTLSGVLAGEAGMTLRLTQASQTVSARAMTTIEAKLVAYQQSQTLIAHDQPGTAIQAQARVMVQA